MGNRNRISGVNEMVGGDGGGDGDGDVQSPKAATELECDAGLGLNMQHQTEPSYPCKKTSLMSHPFPYQHQNHHRHHQASEIGGDFGGFYGNSGSQLFVNPTNTSNQIASGISLKSTAGAGTVGLMAASGKVLFTATQWQELERQTVIYKYIMASIPVPPQLLLPLSTQSNSVSMGLRFSTASDPEPWRCRRTDGKKWRCSRDVARDQKYCEHHAHKSRPRSRKHVEIQSHNTNFSTNSLNTKDKYHPLLPSADMNSITNNNPSMLSTAASENQQTRCTDWFMKSGAIPVCQSSNQFQQPMHSPSGGSKRDQMFKQDFKGNHMHKSYLDHNNPYLNTTGTSTTANDAAAGATRQHCIDAWSRMGSGDDCSLTLSMQSGGKGMEFEDHESFQMAVGMLDAGRGGCGDVFKSHHQWLNQASWAGSTPGGPLGEALCLGVASTTNMPPNVPSTDGYSNSTTTSSSCEGGGGHGLGFIR